MTGFPGIVTPIFALIFGIMHNHIRFVPVLFEKSVLKLKCTGIFGMISGMGNALPFFRFFVKYHTVKRIRLNFVQSAKIELIALNGIDFFVKKLYYYIVRGMPSRHYQMARILGGILT